MYKATLFKMIKNWKQPKCTSVREGINTAVLIYTCIPLLLSRKVLYTNTSNDADYSQKHTKPDFIHRVEFGEVSGPRVLLKRGPGNRGPMECGTTHEATSHFAQLRRLLRSKEPWNLLNCTSRYCHELTHPKSLRNNQLAVKSAGSQARYLGSHLTSVWLV